MHTPNIKVAAPRSADTYRSFRRNLARELKTKFPWAYPIFDEKGGIRQLTPALYHEGFSPKRHRKTVVNRMPGKRYPYASTKRGGKSNEQ